MTTISYLVADLGNIETVVENRIRFAVELSGEQDNHKVAELRKNMSAYFHKATAEGTCLSVIAKCAGQVAGIGSVHFREVPGNFKNPSGKWGYIMNMYTVPEFRRKGVCRGVLQRLVDECHKKGVTALELHATPEGEMVYRKFGFVPHHEPTLRRFS
jgi:predicted acetyltransferase